VKLTSASNLRPSHDRGMASRQVREGLNHSPMVVRLRFADLTRRVGYHDAKSTRLYTALYSLKARYARPARRQVPIVRGLPNCEQALFAFWRTEIPEGSC